jgi:hypothetical protein
MLRVLLVAVAGLIAASSGCMTAHPIHQQVNVGSRQLELTFTTPREIEARGRSGARIVLQDLHGVRGRAVELRGDTLVLEIAWWRASGIWQREAPPVVATLRVSEVGAPLRERRVSAGRTVALLTVTPAVLFLLALALYFLLGPGEGTT